MSAVKYSIVVPVYNSANSLAALDEAIRSYFGTDQTFEIIYVDDYSTDGVWEVMKSLANRFPNTKLVRFSRNFGQHAATICGFKHSKGQFVITIDDDLEVHPSQIAHLVKVQQEQNSDLTYGLYKKLNKQSVKTLLTRLYKLASKVEGKQKGKGSSFRLLKGDLARTIAANHQQFVFIDELCLWYTAKLQFVDVDANPGFIEKKRYRMRSLFKMTSTVIMFSSTYPLRIVTYFGLLLSGVNFVVGSIYLLRKLLFKIQAEGYTSLIVSILFSTGLIILCLGIIAQYISKVLKGVNNAPSYYEDEVIC